MKKKNIFELPDSVVMPPGHAEKYEQFLQMIADAKSGGIDTIITKPEALGRTYEEILTNLRLIAHAKLTLVLAS